MKSSEYLNMDNRGTGTKLEGREISRKSEEERVLKIVHLHHEFGRHCAGDLDAGHVTWSAGGTKNHGARRDWWCMSQGEA